MLKKTTLLFLFSAILFSREFNLKMDILEFRFHGNFCGANLPLINQKTKEEEMYILNNILPIDLIDEACKKHDMCYLDTSSKKSVCDQRLVINIEKFHNKLKDKSCKRLSESIRYFFTLKTDNPLRAIHSDDSLKDKIFITPAVTFSNMINTASLASVLALNYVYHKPHGYIFDSKNNAQRRKEVLQVFPRRFKVCELAK
jgi:hypothetical protein